MLHWSIPLIAVPTFVALLLLSANVRALVVTTGRVGYSALNCLCARLSGCLDAVLRPRYFDGSVAISRYLLWHLVNAMAFAALEYWRVSNPAHVLAGAALLTAMHGLLVTASILKITEENRIMRQGKSKHGVLFAPRAAVGNIWVIVVEMGFVVISSTLLLQSCTTEWRGLVLERVPDTGLAFVDHLLCLLSALPPWSLLVQATEFASEIKFGGLLGSRVQAAIGAAGTTVLLGALIAWAQQTSAIAALMEQLESVDGDDAHFLQLVISRAPAQIKVPLLALALDGRKPRGQLRAINTMRHIKVWTFPQTFLYHLDRFEQKMQLAGLVQIRQFLASDGAAFDPDFLVGILGTALRQHVALAPRVADRIEDAVLSRLDAVIADCAGLLLTRGVRMTTSPAHYGIMLGIAKVHKEDAVRRAMADVLMTVGPKGFLMNYLVNLHDRILGPVDLEIAEKFVGYVQMRSAQFSLEDSAKITRRLHWNLAQASLCDLMKARLADIRALLRQAPVSTR